MVENLSNRQQSKKVDKAVDKARYGLHKDYDPSSALLPTPKKLKHLLLWIMVSI